VEVCHKVRYRNFRGRLLEVVFIAISLLFNEILKISPVLVTVENFFYLLLFLSVNDYEGWWRLCSSTRYRIFGDGCQFYYVKD